MYKLNDEMKQEIERRAFFSIMPALNSFEGTDAERNGLVSAVLNKRKMKRVERKIISMAMEDHGYSRMRAIEELNAGNLQEWFNNIDWDAVMDFIGKILELLIKVM